MVGIRSIAGATGFSVATVSRVLNGKAHVSAETRQAITQCLESSGYVPKIVSSHGHRKSVGVLCSDVRAMVFSQILYSIDSSLAEAGYDALVGSTGLDMEGRKRRMEHLIAQGVSGLILIGSYFTTGSSEACVLSAAQRLPVVMVNNDLHAPNVHCVLCDEYGAFHDNAARLVAHDPRPVLCLYDLETASCHSKIAGVRQAFVDVGLACDSCQVMRVSLDIECTRTAVRDLWTGGQRFQAVFATEDALAVGAIKGLQDAGVRVPHDVQVLGCNNTQLAEACTPGLSSVDNKPNALGVMAARILLDAVQQREVPARVVLSAETVVRGSLILPQA